jgi:hypothetical protein
MEEDGGSAEFAAKFHANPDDQRIAFARRGGLWQPHGAFYVVHFVLTANYLTD